MISGYSKSQYWYLVGLLYEGLDNVIDRRARNKNIYFCISTIYSSYYYLCIFKPITKFTSVIKISDITVLDLEEITNVEQDSKKKC